MADTTSNAFHRLPEEVLSMIVDHTADRSWSPEFCFDKQLLKDIRLVHPRFNGLRLIRSELYHMMKFPLRPERCGKAALSFVAPYVTDVAFRPISQEEINEGKTKKEWIGVLGVLNQAQSIKIDSTCGTPDFLAFVVSCLAVADVKAKKLVITQRDMSGDWETPDWGTPEWSSLALERLQCLELDSDELIPAPALAELLSACQNTLLTLNIQCEKQTFWPNDDPPTLPALTSLDIWGGKINPSTYAAWIAKCHSLEKLSLWRLVDTKMDDLMPWKPVFDAIRSHPSKMFVDFDEFIHINHCHKVWVRHHTSQPAKKRPADDWQVHSRGYMGDMGDGNAFDLENYMSGYGPWNFTSWADKVKELHGGFRRQRRRR